MTNTIMIGNRKGGVAKTTTAVTLAHGLALAGYRTLLIDLDSQGHCATALGMDPEPGIFDLLITRQPGDNLIRDTGRPRLTLLPSNSRTNTAAHIAQIEHLSIGELPAALDQLNDRYEYFVIDTPPTGYFQEVALFMADTLVLPAALDFLALDGVRAVLDIARQIDTTHHHQPVQKFLVPVFYDHTVESRYNLDIMQKNFGDCVAEPVPRRVKVREATAAGQTLFEYAPDDDSTVAYRQLLSRITGDNISVQQRNL